MTVKSKSIKAKYGNWELAAAAPESHFQAFSEYPRVVAQLLLNRGIRTTEAAAHFFAPDYERDLEPAEGLKDLPQAATEIERTIAAQQKIVIHGDYDADGLTSAALLADAIRSIGGDVTTFVPDRYRDGYGVTTENLTRFIQEKIGLVITVDCGIACAPEIALARQDKLKVIVTDHHEPPSEIPETEAVINPKRPGDQYRNKELTGAGVAFKLAQQLLRRSSLSAPAKEAAEKWLLDLVAIGTVADLAELRGENRALVHFGLTVLRKSPRPGIQALLTVAGTEQSAISAGTIGFALAPRLNAAGRLGGADEALQLLTTKDRVEAKRLAERLEQLNRERRELTETAVDEARTKLGKVTDRDAIIIVDGVWKSGIAGLIAGRLSQTYGRPALVLGKDGDTYTGSARSTPQLNITEALRAHEQLLERFGGHAQAAGLTVRADRLEQLKSALRAFAGKRLSAEDFLTHRQVDADLELAEFTEETARWLERFEPHGRGNPRPVLRLRRATVVQSGLVGAEGRHLKLQLSLTDGRSVAAIAFGAGDRATEAKRGVELEVLGRPSLNEWKGRTSLEWHVDDFRIA